MSKPKRRTMRRLKRTLGVTAIILALLIAAIPEMGEAAPGRWGNYTVDLIGTNTTTTQFNMEYSRQEGSGDDASNPDPNEDATVRGMRVTLKNFSATTNDDFSTPDHPSYDYRIYLNRVNKSSTNIVSPWFRGFYYYYEITVEHEDYASYYAAHEAWLALEASVRDTTPEPLESDYFRKDPNASYTFGVSFDYDDFFSGSPNRYYPSVYYNSLSGAADYGQELGGSSAITAAQLSTAGVQSNSRNLTFNTTFANIGSDCQVYVFVDTEPHGELYLDPNDYRKDNGQGDSIYLSGIVDGSDEYFEIPASESISLSDGLRSMYIPEQKVYLQTSSNSSIVGEVTSGAGLASNAEVIDAFNVDLWNAERSESARSMFGTSDLANFNSHSVRIMMPLNGATTGIGSYNAFIPEKDLMQLYYYDESYGSWRAYYSEATNPINDGTSYMWLDFDYRPTMSKLALVIVRSTAIYVTDARNASLGYQKVADQYLAEPAAALTKSWNVNLQDNGVAGSDTWRAIEAVTAGTDPLYDSGYVTNDVEILRVTTSPVDGVAATAPAYDLKVGIKDTWTNVDGKKIYLYRKDTGSTASMTTAAYWDDPEELTLEYTDSYTGYVSFSVNPADDGDTYVLYYQAPKDRTGTINAWEDLRTHGPRADRDWGWRDNGFQGRLLNGAKTLGGDYTLVIKEKKNRNDFWIDENDASVSEYQDDICHYDIYLAQASNLNQPVYGVQYDTSSPAIEVQLPLPRDWNDIGNNVILAVAHKDVGSSTHNTPTYGWPFTPDTSNNIITFEIDRFSEFAVFYSDASSEPHFEVDVFGYSENRGGHDFDAQTTKTLRNTEWKLILSDAQDIQKSNMTDAINTWASSVGGKANNRTSKYYTPFYIDLKERRNQGNWTTLSREDANTTLGSDSIKVYMALPYEVMDNYKSGDAIEVYSWVKDESVITSKRVRLAPTAGPIDYNNVSKGYITFTINANNSGDWFTPHNPYELVYTPGGGSPSPTPEQSGFRIDDHASTLATYAGGITSPTTVEGQSWKLVVKDAFTQTAAIKGKLTPLGEVYSQDKVTVYPYDMKLCYDYGTSDTSEMEVSESDYANTSISLTIPFPLELKNNLKQGDAVEFFEMDRRSPNLLKPVLDGAEVDLAAKTITFTSREMLSYNPYAIVHVPKDDPIPEEDEIDAIAWPTAVEFPDSDLDSTVDFMGYAPDKQPKAGTNAPNSEKWKVLLSQYTPDSQAENTEIANKIKAENQSVSIYRPTTTSETTTSTSSAGSTGTKTTTTTTKTYGKSTIKVYNLQLWENDNGTWTKVDNDKLSRENPKVGVSVTLWLDGSLVGNKGKAKIFTLDPDSNNRLEPLTNPVTIGADLVETSFTTYHFSQYAIVYTPDVVTTTKTDSESTTGTSSNAGVSNSSNSGTSGSNSSGAGQTVRSGASTNASTGTGAGGGGYNRASGDGKVDMPRTADATTYKAIFILILLAFGAFELISSMPARKKVQAKKQQ